MNILYLADPNSIHDLKWISYFSNQDKHSCYLLVRAHHFELLENKEEVEKEKNLKIVETIDDFSIRRINKSLRAAGKIARAIKAHKIDLFHIMYAEPNALWGLFKKKNNIPFVLTTRGTDVLKTIPNFASKTAPFSFLIHKIYRKAFRNFDYIFSTSSRQIDSIRNQFGIKANICHLIRTGVDISIKDIVYEKPHDKPYLFFPRLMRPIYNHEFALDALLQLDVSLAGKYDFVFVGRNGKDKDYVKKIEQLIKKHPCKDRIILKDALSSKELYAHYQHAALVIMTPLSDGSPVSAIESMLFKVPVILPDLDYDDELFCDVKKYKQGNVSDLSQMIKAILLGQIEPSLENCFNRAINHANRETEMNRLNEKYEAILSVESN